MSESSSSSTGLVLTVSLVLPDQEPRTFVYDFHQDTIRLGRDGDNDVQMPLTTVSRHHARITEEGGDLFIEDLGSTHGTRVNGKLLSPKTKVLLRTSDEIQIVSFELRLRRSTQAALEKQPGEKTEQLARRMVQEVLASVGGADGAPPSLRVMNGPDEGLRLALTDDRAEVTFGRSPDCDVCLKDANVSRHHCLIKRNWHGFTAQDLGSKNGVLVRGKAIKGAQLLRDGDLIQVGGTRIMFLDPAARLLEQMGGIEPSGAEGEAEASEEDEAAVDDPHPEMDVAPPEPSEGPPPEPPAPVVPEVPAPEVPELTPEQREVLEAVGREVAAVTAKGSRLDLVILAVGALLLLVLLGAVAFLLV